MPGHRVSESAFSNLFTHLALGALKLKHRVVLAPLTRNRATQSLIHSRTWYPDALNVEYYVQRATPGGLLISEAIPISIQSSGLLGVPGLFTYEQKLGWRKVIDAVHAKGSIFVTQLWHQGRTTHTRLTGAPLLAPSAVAISEGKHVWQGVVAADWEVPKGMTPEDIDIVKMEYVAAAKAAREVEADGVEVLAANGYLVDQFLHSNINVRTDKYGGTPENRCRFLLEIIVELGIAIGFDRIGVRLSPFGLFQQTRGQERILQWTYLCKELNRLGVAYVHLIEPRFDEVRSEADKLRSLCSTSTLPSVDERKAELTSEQLTLLPFRVELRTTPVIVAGGYNPSNCWEGIQRGDHDAIAFGRYFTSNADLVERLRTRMPLGSRFYGPFSDNHIGYTVHEHQQIAAADEAPRTSHGQ